LAGRAKWNLDKFPILNSQIGSKAFQHISVQVGGNSISFVLAEEQLKKLQAGKTNRARRPSS
jgi:hypothetical protein